MKSNFRQAFNALQKIGCPVYTRVDIKNFQISAEGIIGKYDQSILWADFYDGCKIPDWNFGINPLIENILDKYNLHCEWINAGEIGVYE
jgi:hypothetical protein